MGQRLDLQAILSAIPGVAQVYFQPTSDVMLKYPCIVYRRDNVVITHADNRPYSATKVYKVTIIDRDPDSLIGDQVARQTGAAFSTFFVADGLNHDVYTLHY